MSTFLSNLDKLDLRLQLKQAMKKLIELKGRILN